MTAEDQQAPQPAERPLPTGTVKYYERHLFVCSGQSDWPAYIDQDGGFAQRLIQEVAGQAAIMPRVVKITACDEPSLGAGGHDLLVFPDGIRYLGLREEDLPALVSDHLIGDRPSPRIPYRSLSDRYVFVCVHGRRDERCGRCGPPLVARFQGELVRRGLAEEVLVRRTSHLGGHAYAGNVIVYPGGDWYGYVTPDDVPRLIDQHLVRGELVAALWRGRMGLTTYDQFGVVIDRS
jgi:(2Fe-2S) ferredoxin